MLKLNTPKIYCGLDVLRTNGYDCLKGRRIGLVANPASVASDLVHILDLFRQARLDIRVLFGPEHGFWGYAQDMEKIENKDFKIPCYSLYQDNTASLSIPQDALSDIDVLVVDLQDIGTRFYTYASTLLYCMEECAKAKVAVLVLDRPNPINGLDIEGPLLCDEFYFSFVGAYRVPVRHGLTIGELATLAQRDKIDVDLEVICLQGWKRSMWFSNTGLVWILTSPNMPTLDTALVYPGTCLIEATNLSEGRGTTRPFELVGSPWLDGEKLRACMNAFDLQGVCFRPVSFVPTFNKHKGYICYGIQLHVTDPTCFRPFLTGTLFLQCARAQNPANFHWRREPYEFVSKCLAIDLLTGSANIRETLDSGKDVRDLLPGWEQDVQEFRQSRRDFLLYAEKDE